MTESSRREQIALALKQREQNTNGETEREPLRGRELLPVVEVPIDLPVLNHRSFRIAAQLQEHPDRAIVEAEPDSRPAQEIISSLVTMVHRHVNELKESLKAEGQTDIAMLTRAGVLLNGNTRCVLLRQLSEAGELSRPPRLRVAILPSDYTTNDELELELVLQQRQELKDEYRLINELVMIRRLRDEGFSEQQIAQRQRRRKSGKGSGEEQVKDRLAVLSMMEHMRHLADPPLRLTQFDDVRDKFEVWYELLGEFRTLESQRPDVVDAHLRRWLIAYLSGVNSVHNLRHAKDNWIENGVISNLSTDAKAIVQAHYAEHRREDAPKPSGLDILGGSDDPGPPDTPLQVNALFNAVVEACRLGENGAFRTDMGVEVSTQDFIKTVAVAIKRTLASLRKDSDGVGALDKPGENLTRARDELAECLDRLDELVGDASFASRRRGVTDLAKDVAEVAKRIVSCLLNDQRD